MDDFPIDKVNISGATLASLLHRSAASPADLHGFLFGHATLSIPTPLSDDSTSAAATQIITATITSFLSLPSHLALPPPSPSPSTASLLGWFSARRKTPLRPSLRDSTTTLTLSSSLSLAFTPQNSTISLPPSLFLLLTTPFQDQLIHTHEYKAFQYRIPAYSFEPKSLTIINIGPSFRSQFDFFVPNAPFPFMDFEPRGSDAMAEDDKEQTLGSTKRNLVNQKQLDMHAEGFDIHRLNKLVGTEAVNYTNELEDLYGKMLAKIDGLSRSVEQTSAKVLEQENHNMRLRYKVAGLE
ncbi:uncharacterized protein LOC142540248 [Primulina tabacum]|uniref:uncharacterized protein LOC142540248 n=1 Tax=Primulina tabacum TaxID=48773 RepID=UPI003F5908B3